MQFQENGSVIPDQTPVVSARNLKSLMIFFLFSFTSANAAFASILEIFWCRRRLLCWFMEEINKFPISEPAELLIAPTNKRL